MSILTYVFVWVFVMYKFWRMTIHIPMGFRHVHVCTNDYPYYCVWVFVMYKFVRMSIHILIGLVMYMFVRMTIHFFWMGFRNVHVCTKDYPFLSNGFSSCTCLYEGLSISFEWVFVMYMFVQTTIHFFWMDFCHVHVYTNDYAIPYEWVFVMYMFVRMTIQFQLNGFSSCTFMYKWLSISFECVFVMYMFVRITFHIHCIWIFFMHISVRMTFRILSVFPCVQCSSTRE